MIIIIIIINLSLHIACNKKARQFKNGYRVDIFIRIEMISVVLYSDNIFYKKPYL